MKLFVTNFEKHIWIHEVVDCIACTLLRMFDSSVFMLRCITNNCQYQAKQEREVCAKFFAKCLTLNAAFWKFVKRIDMAKQIVQHYNPAAPMTIVFLAGPATACIKCLELWIVLFLRWCMACLAMINCVLSSQKRQAVDVSLFRWQPACREGFELFNACMCMSLLVLLKPIRHIQLRGVVNGAQQRLTKLTWQIDPVALLLVV